MPYAIRALAVVRETMDRKTVALTAGAIGAGIALAYVAQPGPNNYPETITCQRVHIDNLAPEAVEAIDRIHWRYPAERVVIDGADGSVRALPVALVPPPCNPRIEEDEALVIGR